MARALGLVRVEQPGAARQEPVLAARAPVVPRVLEQAALLLAPVVRQPSVQPLSSRVSL